MSNHNQLWNIGLEFLPIEDMIKLADLLDPQNGDITMDTFAQRVDRLYDYRLQLTSQKLTAIRQGRLGERPTLVLLREYLQPYGVSIGKIKYVLDNMRAATTNIFDITRILQMYNASLMTYPSGSTPSQHPCPCQECNIRMLNQGINATQQLPGSPTRVNLPQPVPNGVDHTRRPESIMQSYPCASGSRLFSGSERQNWIPPESECNCELPSCRECERRRLSDPEQTVVLSVHEQTASSRINRLNRSASRVSGRLPDEHRNIDDEELLHEVSYTENPTNSVDLRCPPEGTSIPGLSSESQSLSKSRLHGKHQDATVQVRCTCRKVNASACTCTNMKKAQSQQQSVSSRDGDKSNRWSTESAPLMCQNCPDGIVENSNYSEDTMYSRQSAKSSSDSDISYASNDKLTNNEPGNRVFISYTDDRKDDVLHLAENLIRHGFEVSTDMHANSYFKAKNRRLVSENDQCAWLRNKYFQAKYIIVCLSNGYIECLNMSRNSAFPSDQYLNARYIYDLIDNDPERNRRVVKVTFGNSFPCYGSYFPYAKRFNIPGEIQALQCFLRN